MMWLTIFKHIIPYIWDVFIKKYDEDGNPVLWSKTMILGVVIVIIFIYSHLYSFIHTNTEAEHTLNVKNNALIAQMKDKIIALEQLNTTLVIERDDIRHDVLKTKAQLSETRLDNIQLQEKLAECQINNHPILPLINDTKQQKTIDDIDLILRGK